MNSAENSPGKQQQDDFYDAAPLEPHLIYQGEILIDVPLFIVPFSELGNRWLILRSSKGKPIHQMLKDGETPTWMQVLDPKKSEIAWDEDGTKGDSVMGYMSKHPVVVLSQTCDVETKKFIQVAPVYPTVDDGYIGKLMRDEVVSAFWVKKHPPLWEKEMYADFEHIQAVHKSYRKKPSPHFRLAPKKVLDLQRAITRYFGRPNSFDAKKDLAPRSATYLCVGCFHFNGVATGIHVDEGKAFPVCEVCEGAAWTIQIGSLPENQSR
ncbi:MAG TPA: hypothetical protein VNX26_17180 [Candidatus Acidoferrum sp.]|nr:hypothetical protein [Candidatus Acidoferrum sp.]